MLRVRWNVTVRPPRSKVQPPLVTSMFSLTVTLIAVHGPLVGAHSTVSVF